MFYRLLFWSDVGERPRIERSSLDGAGRRVFVLEDLGSPFHLSIDYRSKRYQVHKTLYIYIYMEFNIGYYYQPHQCSEMYMNIILWSSNQTRLCEIASLPPIVVSYDRCTRLRCPRLDCPPAC